MDIDNGRELSELTADIVAAYVSNNTVRPEDLASVIANVHSALQGVPSSAAAPEPEPREPAVSIRKSVTPDHIVCLEDGKKFKSLKRHLQNEHGMSPAEYRAKWGLKNDYPMVAPNYSESRSSLAKSLGLGRKAGSNSTEGELGPSNGDASQSQTPKRRRRAATAG